MSYPTSDQNNQPLDDLEVLADNAFLAEVCKLAKPFRWIDTGKPLAA
ncbi:MAG: hypothetical protein VBE63_10385 [Lamprobacter sp.]|nr:hypothetical protein [Lamprobacter sp.]MEA3640340.1 hypothetical protein [Lamprobacter sp.]